MGSCLRAMAGRGCEAAVGLRHPGFQKIQFSPFTRRRAEQCSNVKKKKCQTFPSWSPFSRMWGFGETSVLCHVKDKITKNFEQILHSFNMKFQKINFGQTVFNLHLQPPVRL